MYAKGLDKEYLEKRLKITNITPDGKHIYINNKEVPQYEINTGHMVFRAYDSVLFKQIYPITKCISAGTVIVPVHRAVYAWFNGTIKDGMVVDHKNDDKKDNRLANLQLLTPKENIWKNRECDVYELKCVLSKPRSYYESKLEHYLAAYETAKINKDAELVHKLRSNVSQCRARLRYWDSHH